MLLNNKGPARRPGPARLLTSASMKRFWLLLLALVMPLQMSWAAVHFCDDSKLYAASTHEAGVRHADPARQAAVDSAHVQGLAGAAEACCGAVHACHGLHSVMPHEAVALSAGSSPRIVPAFQPRLVPGTDPPRHERPKWLVA